MWRSPVLHERAGDSSSVPVSLTLTFPRFLPAVLWLSCWSVTTVSVVHLSALMKAAYPMVPLGLLFMCRGGLLARGGRRRTRLWKQGRCVCPCESCCGLAISVPDPGH
ncbi:unnamed protein product [Boreogadus saida]